MLGLRLIARQVFQTTSREALLLLVVFWGFLWAHLVNHLRIEWTVNPQYGYGWAVPLLCAYLIWQRISKSEIRNQKSGPPNPRSQTPDAICHPPSSIFIFLCVLLALLYAPTRLLEDATPEWRLVSWALALDVVGLTLLLVHLVLGAQELKWLAFPIAYFLVAVPWPTVVEGPLIQGLTRADAGATVELLGWFGIPAMPHGNVIEVATGEVGIDEACSGIRSFQATLMISLFLGEFYRLNFPRRLVLIFGGFAMSFGFNLARMSVLVWVAAHHGIAAIERWHDPTGVTILLACFVALWGLGIFLARRKSPVQPASGHISPAKIPQPKRRLVPLLMALVVWFALVEIAVEGWYRWHERRLPPATHWTMAWPTNNPTFKNASLPEKARQILRYDEGRSVAWAAEGMEWQAVFLRWQPGRTALHLAQNHTPEVCLTAAGHALKTLSDRTWFTVGGVRLPFIVYAVENTSKPVYVFYCLWDDRASVQGRGTLSLNYGNRLAPMLQGLRNPGQRSLEIALTGNLEATQAEAALQSQLEKIISSGPVNLPADGAK
jgi:exosortase